jgi:hypothetical protein
MSDFLEYLFGSKRKLRLIKVFILNPEAEYNAKELAQRIKFPLRSVNLELEKLHAFGLIKYRTKKRQKYYYLDKSFIYLQELKSFISRGSVTPDGKIITQLRNAGDITYAILTGIFTDNPKSITDLLIAGDNLERAKILKIIQELEAEAGREIRYSLMDTRELLYRIEMLDKFVSSIMKGENIVLVDNVREKKKIYRARLNSVY